MGDFGIAKTMVNGLRRLDRDAWLFPTCSLFELAGLHTSMCKDQDWLFTQCLLSRMLRVFPPPLRHAILFESRSMPGSMADVCRARCSGDPWIAQHSKCRKSRTTGHQTCGQWVGVSNLLLVLGSMHVSAQVAFCMRCALCRRPTVLNCTYLPNRG